MLLDAAVMERKEFRSPDFEKKIVHLMKGDLYILKSVSPANGEWIPKGKQQCLMNKKASSPI